MTLEALRRAQRSQPFVPFRIRLADGQSFDVPHPEFLFVPPIASRTFLITTVGDGYRVIDVFLVSALEFGEGSMRRAG